MSVEDVCELGGLLRGHDDEKRILEKRLIELNGVIQSQEGRITREVEENESYGRRQRDLLQRAQDIETEFEIAAATVTQLHSDTIDNAIVDDILERIENYVASHEQASELTSLLRDEMIRLTKILDDIEKDRGGEDAISTGKLKQVVDSKQRDMVSKYPVDDIVEQISAKETEIGEVKVVIAEIDAACPVLEQRIRMTQEKSNEIAERMEGDRAAAEQSKEQLRRDHLQVTSRVQKVVEKRTIASQELAQANEELSALDKEILLAKERVKSEEERSAQTLAAESAAATELESCRALLRQKEQLRNEKAAEVSLLKKELGYAKLREDTLTAQLSGSERVTGISSEVTALKSTLDTLNEDIRRIKLQLASSGNNNPDNSSSSSTDPDSTNSNSGLSEMKRRREEAQALLSSRIAERDSLLQKIESATARVSNLQEKITQLEVQHAEGSEDLQGAKERLEALSEELATYVSLSAAVTAGNAVSGEHDGEECDETGEEGDEAHRVCQKRNQDAEVAALEEALHREEEELAQALAHSEDIATAMQRHREQRMAYDAVKANTYAKKETEDRLKVAIEKQLHTYSLELTKLEKEVQAADKAFQQQVKTSDKKAREEEAKLIKIIEGLQRVQETLTNQKKDLANQVTEIEKRLGVPLSSFGSSKSMTASASASSTAAAAAVASVSGHSQQNASQTANAANKASKSSGNNNSRGLRNRSVNESDPRVHFQEPATPDGSDWASSEPAPPPTPAAAVAATSVAIPTKHSKNKSTVSSSMPRVPANTDAENLHPQQSKYFSSQVHSQLSATAPGSSIPVRGSAKTKPDSIIATTADTNDNTAATSAGVAAGGAGVGKKRHRMSAGSATDRGAAGENTKLPRG